MRRAAIVGIAALAVLVLSLRGSPAQAQVAVSLPDAQGGVGEQLSVPLTVGDLTGQGVLSYQLTLAFDPQVVRITGVGRAGTLSENATVVHNVAAPGTLKIAAAASTELSGGGALLQLEAQLVGAGVSALELVSVELGDTTSATRIDGSLSADGELIVNEVARGADAAQDWVELLVMQDHLDLRGVSVRDYAGPATADGGFSFVDDPVWSDLRAGTIIVVGGSQANLVEDADAADLRLVLLHDGNAPNPLLSGPGLQLDGPEDAVEIRRADTTAVAAVAWGAAFETVLPGRVAELPSLAVDAGSVLQFTGATAGHYTDPAAWVALPGDGSPGFANGAANRELFAERRQAAEDRVVAWLPEITTDVGRRVRSAVRVNDLSGLGVYAYLLRFTYDPTVVQVRGVAAAGTLSESMTLVVDNPGDGTVTVAASSAAPLTGAGELLSLDLQLLRRGVADLRWTDFEVNEGMPAASAVNGRVVSLAGSGNGLQLQLGDVDGQVGTTGSVPVVVSELAGAGVLGYTFELSFDPRVIAFTHAITAGTLSAGDSATLHTVAPGRVRVSAASSDTLTGAGTLVELGVQFLAGGATDLVWEEAVLNEFAPDAQTVGARVTATGEAAIHEVALPDTGAAGGPGGWVELVVVEDGLDLRGYELVAIDAGGFEVGGVTLAQDPAWQRLRAGTLIVLADSSAVASSPGSRLALDEDSDDFVVVVSSGVPVNSLVEGNLGGAGAAAYELRRPEGTHVFGLSWGFGNGGLVPGLGLHVEDEPARDDSSLAYGGGRTTALTDAADWGLVPATPGRGNTGADAIWVDDLRLASAGPVVVLLDELGERLTGRDGVWRIRVGELGGRGVLGYGFELRYDPEVTQVLDVRAAGTLSEGLTLVTNTLTPGTIRIAASGTTPLSGHGALLDIDVVYTDRGPSDLTWSEFAFNEGTPTALALDGSAERAVGEAGGLSVSLPDAEGEAGWLDTLAVGVTGLDGAGVLGYSFTAVFDTALMRVHGVSATNTASQPANLLVNLDEPGRVRVAASDSVALAGSDTLLELYVEYRGFGTGELRWQQFLFNEGDPAVDAIDGSITVADFTPPVIQETTQLPDTGNKAGPFEVRARITDNVALAQARLYWRRQGDVSFMPVPMVADDTSQVDLFRGQIPGQSDRGIIEYYVEATDAAGNVATDPATAPATVLTFLIHSGPVLAALADTTIAEGDTLRLRLSAYDADGDSLTFSVAGQPPGSVLTDSTFTWVPTYAQAGVYAGVTFTVTDTHELSSSQTITITVADRNRAPILEPIGDRSLTLDQPLELVLRAIDADGDTVSFTVDGAPTGSALLDSTYGWGPGAVVPGVYEVTFSASDGKGGLDSETVTLTVLAAFTVRLREGYNLITFGTPAASDSITRILEPIREHVVRVIGFETEDYNPNPPETGGKLYEPGLPDHVNTLHRTDVHLGYWVKVSADDTLVVTRAGAKPVALAVEAGGDELHPVYDFMGIHGHLQIDGEDAPVGTVVEVRDGQGTLAGRTRVRHPGYYGFLPIYRDDTSSPLDEGASRGEWLQLLVDGIPAEERVQWTAFGETEQVDLSVSTPPPLPEDFALAQNYPNPFNPSTSISYDLPRDGAVALTVWNLSGQRVRVLARGQERAGRHVVHWDGRDASGHRVANGVYLCELRAPRFRALRKMVLAK